MKSCQASNFTKMCAVPEKMYDIRPSVKNMIIAAPVMIIFLQAVLMIHPVTRKLSLWMLRENHPVELLTAAALLLGGVISFFLAFKTKKNNEGWIVYSFYTLFSLALIVLGMEEIAWGQSLFKFATPEAWGAINRQGETTLHNLPGLQGHSELLRLTYGIGGLIGVVLFFCPACRKIGVPALLLPWFIVIVVHASVDVFNDYISIQQLFDYLMQRTSELIELFVGISALLYVWLNTRMFEVKWSRGRND